MFHVRAALLVLLCSLCACQGMLSYSAQRTLTGAPSPAGAAILGAEFVHGDLTAVGDAQRSELDVTLQVTVVARSQAIADAVAADLRLVSERVGDVLQVSVAPAAPAWPEQDWQLHVTSHFELPRAMGLDVSTTHGDLELSGLAGDVRARATHGDVEIRDVQGDLDVGTTHGSLELSDVSGDRHVVEATHGDVDVRQLVGDFRIRTTHGDVDARLGRLAGEHEFETTHGSIVVELDPASSLEVRVSTSHGRIRCDLPGAELDLDGDHAAFRLGAGAGSLRLETSHAPVTLRAADADERM